MKDLDLASLVGQIPKPPFRKLGVFELDTFFPEKDRMELAMRLNGLLASPSFASWLEGVPLDIETMIGGGDRTKAAVVCTKAAVVFLAHLSETERQFMVTLLLTRMITWLRSKSGTSDLRALIYMDEVFGYVPPVREPPTKKAILTILKQARAFGVGMVLSTQNPVDLDYKALSNAGTWMIGRLQTETDKKRLLDGLNAASGGVDTGEMDDLISALDKRQFILHSTGSDRPSIFGTRWAQSYLAGPLTRDQVTVLMGDSRSKLSAPTETESPAVAAATTPPGDDDSSVPVMPPVSDSVSTVYADPAAEWLAALDANPTSDTFAIGAAATVQALYDDRSSGLNHQETYEAIIFPLATVLDPSSVVSVDHDERDFGAEPPPAATYEVPGADIEASSFWSGLGKDLKNHLVASRTVRIPPGGLAHCAHPQERPPRHLFQGGRVGGGLPGALRGRGRQSGRRRDGQAQGQVQSTHRQGEGPDLEGRSPCDRAGLESRRQEAGGDPYRRWRPPWWAAWRETELVDAWAGSLATHGNPER
ncbi:MAG: ATP-binding protein [Actinobacteria bacterium]|nr:MAG: ATP-binding protein [Actinomycetota bacterium]